MIDAQSPEHVTRGQLRRAVLASTVGTSIESYDFLLYSSASALVFGGLFFPQADPTTAVLLAFATYFVGFVGRPVGAAIFGHFGDRIGRKTTLVVTLLLTGTCTVLVGLVPPYAAIGIWGGILLTLLRTVQGIGVGGEWGGSVLLSMEWGARTGRRGFVASWPQFGVPVGLILANGILAIITSLYGRGFQDGAWRIPFLLSIVLVGVGLYIRLGIFESPVFARVLADRKIVEAPVSEVLRKNLREVLLACLIRTGQQAPFWIFTTYILVYGTRVLHLSNQMMLSFVMIASFVSLFTIPFWGYVSDRIGRRRLYMIGAATMAVYSFVYFGLLDTAVPALVLLAVVLSLPIHDIQFGPQAAFIAEAFAPRVRYSGSSIGYQLASITAGGPAALIAVALFGAFNSSLPIAIYMALCALISFASATLMPDRGTADIGADVETPDAVIHPPAA